MTIKSFILIHILKNLLKKSGIIGVFLIVFLIIQLYIISNDAHEQKFVSSNIRVVDGDTIVLNNLRIRLQGIDAPELKQECTNLISYQTYKCGEVAKDYLIELIGTAKVACTDEGLDKYRRQLSYCYVDKLNLNREMVKSGNALAYTKYDHSFIIAEIQARWRKAGIWNSTFNNPEDWRKKKKP